MAVVPIILLAIAVSLDGFVVGVTYGLRQLRLPFASLVTIGLTSGLVVFVTMQTGNIIGSMFSIHIARWLGATILVLVGLWVILISRSAAQSKKEKALEFSFRAFGFIVQIIKEPVRADMDHSGEISTKEAILLGIALALDAFGAGLGAALSGFSQIWTPLLVSIFKILFVSFGISLGNRCIDFDGRLALLSGFILILLGLSNLL
jgi:putative sporulation protein YtaF